MYRILGASIDTLEMNGANFVVKAATEQMLFHKFSNLKFSEYYRSIWCDRSSIAWLLTIVITKHPDH